MPKRKGYVFYKNDYAGVLEETPSGGTRFTYDDNYLTQIACVFPTYKQSFEWEHGVHPFFENLAPEGWLKEKQARVGHLQPEDTLGLLLAYGEDCIGAVGVKNNETEQVIDTNLDIETESATSAHRTISGVQRKLLAYTDGKNYYPATKLTPATHIAKLNHHDNPTLVQNEYLTLRLACDVLGKNNVTKFKCSQLSELNEISLLVERFDRTADGQKLRMEEFSQILNKPCGTSFGGKYKGSYEEIAYAIIACSNFGVIDLHRFFKQLVFSILIGNCDAHFKNFALLEDSDNGLRLRLSPAYDLLNTLIYPEKGYSSSLALEICGQKRQWDTIDRNIVIQFGRSIGLTMEAVALALSQIAKNMKKSKYLTLHPAANHDDFNSKYKQIVDSACLRILE